jgi:hypothetical protein
MTGSASPVILESCGFAEIVRLGLDPFTADSAKAFVKWRDVVMTQGFRLSLELLRSEGRFESAFVDAIQNCLSSGQLVFRNEVEVDQDGAAVGADKVFTAEADPFLTMLKLIHQEQKQMRMASDRAHQEITHTFAQMMARQESMMTQQSQVLSKMSDSIEQQHEELLSVIEESTGPSSGASVKVDAPQNTAVLAVGNTVSLESEFDETGVFKQFSNPTGLSSLVNCGVYQSGNSGGEKIGETDQVSEPGRSNAIYREEFTPTSYGARTPSDKQHKEVPATSKISADTGFDKTVSKTSSYSRNNYSRSSRPRSDAFTFKLPAKKLPIFDGSGNFATFLCQFDNLVDNYNLECVASAVFAECLAGRAADFYASLPAVERGEIDVLRRKFSSYYDCAIPLEMLREELRTMQQAPEQTLAGFAQEISIKANRAYPADSASAQYHGVRTFLLGCTGKEVAYHVMLRNPTTIEQALAETQSAALMHRSMFGKEKRIRAISPEVEVRAVQSSAGASAHNSSKGVEEYLTRDMRTVRNEMSHLSEKIDLLFKYCSNNPSALPKLDLSSQKLEKAFNKGKGDAELITSGVSNYSSPGKGVERGFTSSRSPSPTSRGAYSPSRGCFHCGQFGHFKRECPNLSSSPVSSGKGGIFSSAR